MLSRRRARRLFPAPPPTPSGFVWATRDGRTVLVPIDRAQGDAMIRMGKYDLYPREVRDAKKHKAPRPF